MEYTSEDYGRALTQQKIVPGDTRTAIGNEILKYTERTLAYTSGGTTEIKAGDWIVGATSAAVARVVSVTLSSGTWAGGDAAGSFVICSQSGTFQSENILVAGGTNDATIAANSIIRQDDYPNKGQMVRAVLIQVMIQACLVCFDGSLPDQTLLSGLSIASYGTLVLTNYQNAKNFYCVDRVSSSASTVIVIGYF